MARHDRTGGTGTMGIRPGLAALIAGTAGGARTSRRGATPGSGGPATSGVGDGTPAIRPADPPVGEAAPVARVSGGREESEAALPGGIPRAVWRVAARRAARSGERGPWLRNEYLQDMQLAGRMLAKLKAQPQSEAEAAAAARRRADRHASNDAVLDVVVDRILKEIVS